jgi:hypothetical protein
METLISIVPIGGLLAALFFVIRSRRATRITDPTLGLVNLAGDEFLLIMEQDRSTLSPLFRNVEVGTGHAVPSCDVLFIYAIVGADGSIGLGAGVTIRHLAEKAGAKIVVLASNNSADSIGTASRLPGPKKAI